MKILKVGSKAGILLILVVIMLKSGILPSGWKMTRKHLLNEDLRNLFKSKSSNFKIDDLNLPFEIQIKEEKPVLKAPNWVGRSLPFISFGADKVKDFLKNKIDQTDQDSAYELFKNLPSFELNLEDLEEILEDFSE